MFNFQFSILVKDLDYASIGMIKNETVKWFKELVSPPSVIGIP